MKADRLPGALCIGILLVFAQPMHVWAAVPVEAAPSANRPQTPNRPFPYREEEVRFVNAAPVDKVRLAGTLTLPPGAGPFPAAVLVAGSGPHQRDEDNQGHKTFLLLSDYLSRRGIAVLRYDKRGVGESSGNFDEATSADFAGDVDAALAFLRSRHDIDLRRIGLIGHSEGGEIAPMAAARDPAIAFVVLMAGPAENGLKILLQQGALEARAAGMSATAIAEDQHEQAAIYRVIADEVDPALRYSRLREAIAAASGGSASPAVIDERAKALASAWFHYFVTYEPAPTLRKLKMPILALNGSLDRQVPPRENLGVIRAALAGNRDATVTELPGLNHLFQTARTGAPSEYGAIEQTIAPIALETISQWILARVNGRAPGR